ncbi:MULTISPECIES: hypothetical protein [unclassified Crossiella]|uniref:hypothetical protein n=1 Tax=unclassified Crossiella TaxID=2620835 RepID=UPI001FFFF15D|nr:MULTISPECIES: hypothetical protein [unclassified Crossiella]MCK2240079.1 hypothetical protein [Crossiella sp. S99.2]MCK2252788.1 hypothetical protein [Crossiella sp. S99.1]
MPFWLLVLALAAAAALVLAGAAGYTGTLTALADLLARPAEPPGSVTNGLVATTTQQRTWRRQHHPVPLCLASPAPARTPRHAASPPYTV